MEENMKDLSFLDQKQYIPPSNSNLKDIIDLKQGEIYDFQDS